MLQLSNAELRAAVRRAEQEKARYGGRPVEPLLGSPPRPAAHPGPCVVRTGGKASGMWHILLGWARQ